MPKTSETAAATMRLISVKVFTYIPYRSLNKISNITRVSITVPIDPDYQREMRKMNS
jgi:hypothetical protein